MPWKIGIILITTAALFFSGCQEPTPVPLDAATPSALTAPAQAHPKHA